MRELSMRQGLGWRTQQELRLEARMLQSTLVLALPAHELSTWLAEAAEANEALVVEPPPEVSLEPAGARRGASGREAMQRHDELLQNHPERGPELFETLAEQLAWLGLEGEDAAWALLVARSIEPSGWLASSDEELLALAQAEGLAPDRGALARALAAVQRLEPRGVGGRGAIECMLLQLDPAEPDYALLCRMLEELLEPLARNKLPEVARALGVSLPRLEELLARLAQLDPRPGAAFTGADPPPIVPDVLVERDEDGVLSVSALGAGLPDVRLDEEVQRIARDRTLERAVREHLAKRVDQARAIVEAVRQRRQTLLAVAAAAFHRQRAFLEHGPEHLVPLRMGEVALELGMHKSTVSRAVAGKHAQTPWGIVPLRELFQAPAAQASGVAKGGVREALRRIFAAEDPQRPLSDDEAVEALDREGLRVARRTVAKHREALGIKSSYRRRRHA